MVKIDEVVGGFLGFILGGVIAYLKNRYAIPEIVKRIISEEELNKIVNQCGTECRESPVPDICKTMCVIHKLLEKYGLKIGVIGFGSDLAISTPIIYKAIKMRSGFGKGFAGLP